MCRLQVHPTSLSICLRNERWKMFPLLNKKNLIKMQVFDLRWKCFISMKPWWCFIGYQDTSTWPKWSSFLGCWLNEYLISLRIKYNCQPFTTIELQIKIFETLTWAFNWITIKFDSLPSFFLSAKTSVWQDSLLSACHQA